MVFALLISFSQKPPESRSIIHGEERLMFIAEMAGGLLCGLLFGLALGILRTLIIPMIVLAAVVASGVLLVSGVSGLLDILVRMAADMGRHAPFFGALALGHLVSAVLVTR
jgi:hypothetical protein